MNSPKYDNDGQYNQRAATSPPQTPVLNEFSVDIQQATKQLAELSDQARTIADGVFGGQPSVTGAGALGLAGSGTIGLGAAYGIAPQAAGRVYDVRENIQALRSQIAQLRAQIERLSCI